MDLPDKWSPLVDDPNCWYCGPVEDIYGLPTGKEKRANVTILQFYLGCRGQWFKKLLHIRVQQRKRAKDVCRGLYNLIAVLFENVGFFFKSLKIEKEKQ